MVMTIKKGTAKEVIDALLEKLLANEKSKGVDAYKYCGVISLKESPSTIQKNLRSEWD